MTAGSEQSPNGYTTLTFSGRAGEYFKIWIVNLCLTPITLGIYSAWAKVRRLRYFYACTGLDGHTFEYLADPVKVLKGRLIAVALLAVYFTSWQIWPGLAFIMLAVGILALPFLTVMATAFQMRNSSFRHVRFGFMPNYVEAYRIMLIPLTIAFAVGLML